MAQRVDSFEVPSAADDVDVAVRAAAVAAQRTAKAMLRRPMPGIVYPMAGHIGSPAVAIDALAHGAAERAVYELMPGHISVIGEEATRSVYAEPGDYVFVVDPVDGTGPATELGFGWSSVVLAWRCLGDDDWRIDAAAVVTSDDRVVRLTASGAVLTGTVGTDASLDEVLDAPARNARRTRSIATVGAKPSGRAAFDAVAERCAGDAVYNLGGTPLVAALLELDLAAIVRVDWSTPWDAADVLLAASAGAGVATLDGELHDLDQVRRWFARPPLGSDQKTIPACVTGEHPGLALEIARLLAAS